MCQNTKALVLHLAYLFMTATLNNVFIFHTTYPIQEQGGVKVGYIPACKVHKVAYTLHDTWGWCMHAYTFTVALNGNSEVWIYLSTHLQLALATAGWLVNQKIHYLKHINISNQTLLRDCSSEQNENVHRDIVMARVHRLLTWPVCEVWWQKLRVLLLPWHTSVELVTSVANCAPPHCKQQSKEGKGWRGGVFTCEPFLSVVWSCTFGTQCSRHPYTGPYTWQYISVRWKTRGLTFKMI